MLLNNHSRLHLLIFTIMPVIFAAGCRIQTDRPTQGLKVQVTDRPTLIEIGGPYAGIEMHGGNPLLNRISLYYPVANSIDNSNDYWTRDTSRILRLGLRLDDLPAEWLSDSPMTHELTPHHATFTRNINGIDLEITYRFFRSSPAFLFKTVFVNPGGSDVRLEYLTDLNTVLRTSHSYRKIDQAWSSTDSSRSSYYFHYEDMDAGPAVVFCTNRKTRPVSFNTSRELIGQPGTKSHKWLSGAGSLGEIIIEKSEPARPGLAQLYFGVIRPGDSLVVEQIIGACKPGEENITLGNLMANQDFSGTEEIHKPYGSAVVETRDPVIDHSVKWAEAILEANCHYLDGTFVPMPCPAQYNFYFTHDVQVTDLAKVLFHPDQVREDLIFISKHANAEGIIPHAYYWKDGKYVTEYAGSDNWNHFWFIILSGQYLKYSGDFDLLNRLFPLIEKSVRETMGNLKPDGLMWAQRPDWWDIGHDFGPRAYMTILMARALETYTYICVALDRNLEDCPDVEKIIAGLKSGLNTKLWDDASGFLMNYYENGRKDPHFYIGSLLAAHFGTIGDDRIAQLIAAADQNMVDPLIGIFNAAPMDFHTLHDSLSYQQGEAGKIGYYFNGGIWPHGNAWYALALIAHGRKNRAREFVKDIMTVKGIMNSPNGQPAMYEYRISDKNNPDTYGRIDKPQFLWAGGWYLYVLYHLFLIGDDPWNIRFEPYCPGDPAILKVMLPGRSVRIKVQNGNTYGIAALKNGDHFPSMLIPSDYALSENLVVSNGPVRYPVLARTNAILLTIENDSHPARLTARVKAFRGHKNNIRWLTTKEPAQILIYGRPEPAPFQIHKDERGYIIDAGFIHENPVEEISLIFEE